MAPGDGAERTAARFFEQLGEVNQRTAEHAAVLDVHRARMDRFENRLAMDEQRRAQIQADLAAAIALVKETAIQISGLDRRFENLQAEFFNRLTKTLEQGPRLTLRATLLGSVCGGGVVLLALYLYARSKGMTP